MVQTSNTVANQALQLIGDNAPKVSGFDPTWDSSTAGKALQTLYAPTVAAVQRQFGWDASRRMVALTLTDNVGPFLVGQYDLEYLYPGNGIEVWEVQPPDGSGDKNDPLPYNYSPGNTLVDGTQKKVIWTDTVGAVAVYNNNPTESTWDALFVEAVARALASKLAVALAGKPETAVMEGQAGQMAVAIDKTRGG